MCLTVRGQRRENSRSGRNHHRAGRRFRSAVTELQSDPYRCSPAPLALSQRRARAVVHLGKMRHLLGGHIVQHRYRSQDQTPGEDQPAGARTASPARSGVAHGDACDAEADHRGLVMCAGGDFPARLGLQMAGRLTLLVQTDPKDPRHRPAALPSSRMVKAKLTMLIEKSLRDLLL